MTARSKGFTGRKHSPESLAKMSAANRGRKLGPHSPEHRANLSASLRGRKVSPETRVKLSAVHLGHKFTPEHREKLSAAQRGHEVSPETRTKISLARKDRFGGENSSRWKGGKIVKHGYVLLFRPEHPFADCKGYVMEHRLVMEGILGRCLTSGEKVHHRNGVKDDNRSENLQVVAASNHHGEVLCPHCQKHFLIQ